ncbi:E3 ubiquitin-protein ligase TRIM38-like [Sorex araneus]|uniref:E3 ubiquitin-protein ligase TRIM38-like n=1 Tax=Sorex araneus TaxID=42254 RepID=UPI0024334694|nr:E3 ubiquitin-protein ligase TRIM38-like [Sorex araneus]
MASGTSITAMREEATCSICLEMMTGPVSIDCGHTFCCICIMQFFENQRQESLSLGLFRCPVCREHFQQESIRPIRQLENLIDTIRRVEQESLCEEHGEKLCLFCEDDGQLICWRCERTPQHRGHTTVLREEVSPSFKKRFQETVTKLREVDDEYTTLKLDTEDQIIKWNRVIEHRRQRIQSDFKNLHTFLHEEEKSYLWRLEEEKKEILTELENRVATLEDKSQELKMCILELERNREGSAHELLKIIQQYQLALGFGPKLKQNTNKAISHVDRPMSAMAFNAQKPFYRNIGTMCIVSELYFDPKKILEQYQAIITLDPDTAHSVLHLAGDGKQVSWGPPQRKRDTPWRFQVSPCVLGCQTFTTGRYYFEVSIPKGPEWDVGVCLENVPRDSEVTLDPENGFWAIRLCKQNDYVALTSPLTPLCLRELAWFVGVFLDYEAGLVSFYNMYSGSHIFTFPKASFSEPLRPYFRIGKGSHLYLPSV